MRGYQFRWACNSALIRMSVFFSGMGEKSTLLSGNEKLGLPNFPFSLLQPRDARLRDPKKKHKWSLLPLVSPPVACVKGWKLLKDSKFERPEWLAHFSRGRCKYACTAWHLKHAKVSRTHGAVCEEGEQLKTRSPNCWHLERGTCISIFKFQCLAVLQVNRRSVLEM